MGTEGGFYEPSDLGLGLSWLRELAESQTRRQRFQARAVLAELARLQGLADQTAESGSVHRCVDCAALPERTRPGDLIDPAGLSDAELLAAFEARPQRETRPRRPRAVDPRSDPPRCYSHLARAGLPHRRDAPG